MLRQQGTNAAAMVTLPGYLIRRLKDGASTLRRLEWLCDSVIELESFAGVFSLYSSVNLSVVADCLIFP